MSRIAITLVSFVVLATLSSCGGCPLLPHSAGPIEGGPSCLSLDFGRRCVDGVTVTGTNGCTEALVLTPPVSAAKEMTFAAGGRVSFEADQSEGTISASEVTWSVPARVGTQAVTLVLKVPRN